MQEKIRVVAVSYLNTKPLLYGLFKSGLDQQIELELAMPSVCARKLERGEADLGLIPVAAIPGIDSPRIISNYCIGAKGKVDTVCIFSKCPIEEVDKLYLDYHSRTSVQLTRLLFREYWQRDITFLDAHPGYESEIRGTTAGLIIGDRAISQLSAYPYVYDLAECWQSHTGLPFVFAAWVARSPLSATFLQAFNQALALGIDSIPQLQYLLPSPSSGFDLQYYFTQCISYELNAPKRRALQLFLEKSYGSANALFWEEGSASVMRGGAS